MLTYFEIQGFKCFEKSFKLDFSKVRDYQFNTDCTSDGHIKNGIIYGRNGVGKSSFGLALLDITIHLADKNLGPNLYDNYLNVNASEAKFIYKFTFGSDEIEYSYAKIDSKTLVRECLILNGELLMDYDYSSQDGDFEGIKKISPTLNYDYNGEGSILLYILNNTALLEEHPLYKFKNYVSKMLWFRTLDENRYIGYTKKSENYYKFILEDEKVRNEFERLLNEIGINYKLSKRTDIEGNARLYFNMNDKFLPFFQVASSGTKALYTFYYWYKMAKDASFIYIDEFDAYYHFELAEKIVEMVKSMENTQTLVTTHNTNLLSNKIMRPDCYFILTNENIVPITDATERELREGHNLEKLYMAGEFYGN